MNKNQVEDVVRSKKEGSVYDSYGPVQLNDLEVWEVWVRDDGEYATRFVALDTLENSSYFSEFQQLAPHAHKRYEDLKVSNNKLEEELRGKRLQDHQSMVRLYVAAAVFVLSSLALLYLIYKGIEPNLLSFTVLAGIVASGSTMFFGAWRQAHLPS